jgi:hypothetical protein
MSVVHHGARRLFSLNRCQRATDHVHRVLSSTTKSSGIPTSASSSPEILETLNQLWRKSSGTTEISQLKNAVAVASQKFDTATAQITTLRRNLDTCLLEYERISSRHTSMLQNRGHWTPEQATEFSSLVNQEVTTRQTLNQARKELADTEQHLSNCQLEYMNCMRQRYHEEQIWQDKWRIFGTYGTWSLIVLNSILFLSSQYIHNRRETGKIKAIQTLIETKIPHVLTNENAINEGMHKQQSVRPEELMTDAKEVPSKDSTKNEKEKETNLASTKQSTKEGKEGTVQQQSRDNSNHSEKEQAQLTTPRISKVISKVEMATEWFQRRWNNSKAAWNNESETETALGRRVVGLVQEVHVPSAVLGASVTGVVAVLLLSLMSSKR